MSMSVLNDDLYKFAAAVTVVKNMLLTQALTAEDGAKVLWALLDETGIDSLHYTLGWSPTVDKLLEAQREGRRWE